MTAKFEPTPQQENDAEGIVPRGLRRGQSVGEIAAELSSRGWPKEAAAEYVERTQQEIADRQARKALPKSKRDGRPVLITILCVGVFVTAPIGLVMAFSEAARNIGAWYPYFLTFGVLTGLVCTVGFWKMRHWAVWAYVSLFAVGQVILLATGLWQPRSLVFAAVFMTILFCYYRRMQ